MHTQRTNRSMPITAHVQADGRQARRRKGIAGVVVAAGLTVTLAACSGSGSGSTAAKPEIPFGATTATASGAVDSVAWMIPQEPATFDTDVDSGASENTILANVCERLMQVQPDLSTTPHLAASAEWVDDTHVVFELRSDATFHDGSAMTADDVLWSMKRHARDEADESDEYQNVVSMEKTGDAQITVTLSQPDAIFIQAMAGNGGIVWNPRVVEAAGDSFGSPSAPDACSGPYEVSEWQPGVRVVLAATDDYWDTDRKVLTSEITFTWGEQAAVANALTSHEAQGSYLDGPSAAVALASSDGVSLAQGPSTNAWSLISTSRGGATDERIRQALSLALNREGISAAAFGGLAQPWKTPLGSGAWGYEPDAFEAAYVELEGAPEAPSDDDLAKAKELVKEAGAPTTPITVASDGQSVRNVISNALVSAAKSIGLNAEIVSVPSQQYGDFYSDETLRNTADFWSDEYYISKNDPVGFYKNGASTAGVNFVGFADPEYDALVKKAQGSTDDTERAGLAIELEQRWTANMLWVPVVQAPSTLAYASDLTGMPASAAYLYYPWAADVGTAGR